MGQACRWSSKGGWHGCQPLLELPNSLLPGAVDYPPGAQSIDRWGRRSVIEARARTTHCHRPIGTRNSVPVALHITLLLSLEGGLGHRVEHALVPFGERATKVAEFAHESVELLLGRQLSHGCAPFHPIPSS